MLDNQTDVVVTLKQIEKGTLWLFNIAMENGPFIELKMVIFHGYVK